MSGSGALSAEGAPVPFSSLLSVSLLLSAFLPEGGRAARREPLRARCARP